jgi:nucleoid-associated protein YgaU
MGLIDFVKNAGAKLLGRDDEKALEQEAAQRAADEAAREKMRRQKVAGRLLQHLEGLGLTIENADVSYDGETVTLRGQVENQSTREKIVLAVGNHDGVAAVDDQLEVTNTEPEATFYTVKSGDTLSKIAKEHYGKANKYPVIFEANKPMLEHPDRIYPGQVLRIPPLED